MVVSGLCDSVPSMEPHVCTVGGYKHHRMLRPAPHRISWTLWTRCSGVSRVRCQGAALRVLLLRYRLGCAWLLGVGVGG